MTFADLNKRTVAKREDRRSRREELVIAREKSLVHEDLLAIAAKRLRPRVDDALVIDDMEEQVYEGIAAVADLRCEMDAGHMPHVTRKW